MSNKPKQKKVTKKETKKPIKQPIWPFLVPIGIALAYGLTVLQIDLFPKINSAAALPFSLIFIAVIITFWVFLIKKRNEMNSAAFLGGVICGVLFTLEVLGICVVILIMALMSIFH